MNSPITCRSLVPYRRVPATSAMTSSGAGSGDMEMSGETTLDISQTAPEIELVFSSRILPESVVSDEAIIVRENFIRPKPKRPNPLAILTADDIDDEPITKREIQRPMHKNALPRIPRLSTDVVNNREIQARTTIKLRGKRDKAFARRIAADKARREGGGKGKKHCTVCKVFCNSKKVFFDHVNSSKHKNRVNVLKNKYNCSICMRNFENDAAMRNHMNSKNHRARVVEEQELKNTYLMGSTTSDKMVE